MKRFFKDQSLIQLLGWTVVVLTLLLLLLGWWRYSIQPSQANHDKVVRQNLKRAANYFKSKQQRLLGRTELAAAKIKELLDQKHSPEYIYNQLGGFSDFWGLTLYKNKKPYVWKGFGVPKDGPPDFSRRDTTIISLQKDRNVTYWECHLRLATAQHSASYNLVTYYRVEQRNPLALGGKAEFNIFKSSDFSSSYPLRYSVFGPAPEHAKQQHILQNLQKDSVGVVYATADEFQSRQSSWQKNTRFWRSVYVLFCLLVLAYFIVKFSDGMRLATGLALELLFLILGWGLLSYTHLPSYWIQTFASFSSGHLVKNIRQIGSLFTNTSFTLFIALAFTHKLNRFDREITSSWYIPIMCTALLGGLINMISIPFAINLMYQASRSVDISLMTLRIFPGTFVILMYLTIGMAILALGLALVTLNRMLFRLKKRFFGLSVSVLSVSFMISLLVAQLFLPEKFVFNWVFFTSILGFVCIMLVSVAYFKYQNWIDIQSTFRKIVIASLMVSATGMPVVYQVSQSHTDRLLKAKAQKNIREKDPVARGLTKNLLTALEKEFKDVTSAYMNNQPSALQARFGQVLQQSLAKNNEPYSYNVQLINSAGKLLADYATGLHAPNWIQIYNVPTLMGVTQMNGITKSSLRPVIQLPNLTNPQQYQTFYRGWIPLFGESSYKPIGWILCSVYRKHPDYDKPIRAVLASMNVSSMNSYLMQTFVDGKLAAYEQEGPSQYFPKYRRLKKNVQQQINADSLLYITEEINNNPYRSLYWKNKAHQVINVSTVQAGYREILFSSFWLSFSLLLLGTLLTLIFQVATRGRIKFLGNYHYFQDRILDNFLLATLVLIILLIISFHFAIKQQNKNTVKDNLFGKLDKLSSMVKSSGYVKSQDAALLDSLTQPLNVDASYYKNRTLTETTTPQIYQQHLLPSFLSFPVYNQLYVQNQHATYATVKLAGQALAIGYQAILNGQHQPVGVIAIPTFLQSPKYNQQLLEITSYLILFYLLIFALFIIGAVIISGRLTRPLVDIRRGLNSISGGKLETKIKVRNDDEIGQLAKTYNNMIAQLKQLQQELAEAEREAAWKEMAQQVAHEIKNPLTPMKLNIQHLERQLNQHPEDPANLKKQIKKITKNLIEQIQSLNNIASDFSKFSQPLDEPFRKINLSDLLASVAELYEHDDKLRIYLHQPGPPVFTAGIADELKRVFINMIKNAYEAMPKGGEINLKLYSKQHHSFIEIEDNGTGISEENRANIFVPSFSTKSSGTGLGLAICKKIIEAHHGTISFVSIEGEGTTFVIKLPEPNSGKNEEN